MTRPATTISTEAIEGHPGPNQMHAITSNASSPQHTKGTSSEPRQSFAAVVGVLAHNEEATIETSLRALLEELNVSTHVKSLVVVASGCTDSTESIVRGVAACDSRIKLIAEPLRS